MAQEFLGAGWRFPVSLDEADAIALSRYEDNVRESVLTILSTEKGERVMRADFGCDIHRLVFAENNMATAGLATHYVEQALTRWEPRIEMLRVQAARDGERAEVLRVEIEYRVIATNNIFNVVYPFYLTEGAGR
jgi:hypothetical protein